ncbi:class I SAM-dependent methyltransferase [Peribacillus saganii]|uniref:Class I SAM-dependent methyltransferase n=1 Tax=Peribacillus saganii TaxID=2303992 RepID=A0A372LP69_9BACI|nr:class I SAM-dependent methyltransferase [Peribacillus saganii]RFU69689.1 class I SAM-dependent methyltransferase [Peribacillus saganii]
MEEHNWHKEAERKWDNFAKQWSQNSSEMWESGSRKKVIPFISSNLQPGDQVCDLGCGDGYGSLLLAKMGFNVTGLDISSEMVETAAKRAAGQTNTTFVQGDLAELPFEENQFDAILAINSLEWTESPREVLSSIQKILKSGGVACFGILGPTAAPRQNYCFRRLYGEKVIMNTMMPWEFEQMALENGWTLLQETAVEKRGVDFDKLGHFSKELKQAVSFMWLFLLKNDKGE